MAIPLEQFQQTFFEESFEGLEVLEAGLLGLAEGADRSAIDDIFRAAHSIKGGSGTFGFTDITSLTHFLETLLDELREGRRAPESGLTQLLLEGVDGLRYLLETRQAKETPDPARIQAVCQRLAKAAEAPATGKPNVETKAAAVVPEEERATWRIHFRPHRNLLHTGNEPLRILDELSTLGELATTTDTGEVPALAELDAEELFLAWDLRLSTDRPEAAIREVFAWVVDNCELSIAREPAAREPAAQEPGTPQGAAPIETGEPPVPKPGARQMGNDGRRAGESGNSMRVSTEKVDAVINLVGELVITQSMLNCLGENFEMRMMDRLRDGLAQLDRNTRELQETVLKMRMLPMSFCFQRFPRLVHDVSEKLGKQVGLRLSGEQTEMDKTVLERIGDPLVHLVRNALDHGIESPAERRAAGKPEKGTLSLAASHEGGNVVIVVSDDGAGLNAERILAKAIERGLVGPQENLSEERIHQLIFLPGFSTADAVTELSGRGVGMDVVRQNIQELGGSVEISSRRGEGTRLRIRLPLTLSILDGLLVRVGAEAYVIPLTSIVESVQLRLSCLHRLATGEELYRFREDYVPLLRLAEVLGPVLGPLPGPLPGPAPAPARDGIAAEPLLVVVETPARRVGLLVDDLLGQQQVVIKSLEENFYKVEGISGATILGDGQVAMILDLEGLVRLQKRRHHPSGAVAKAARSLLLAEKELHDLNTF